MKTEEDREMAEDLGAIPKPKPRELLEGEVRRIVSPKPYPIIIECPDGTELKVHIRAISFQDLEDATDVISELTHGAIYGAFKVKQMGEAMQSVDEFKEANVFTEEVITNLRDKLLSFLPWFIKCGTDADFKDIEKLDYLIMFEILIEIVRHNFGTRLMDFFSRAKAIVEPLKKDGKMAGLQDGLLPKASSSGADTAQTASGDGVLES